jgi:hypothetical protein
MVNRHKENTKQPPYVSVRNRAGIQSLAGPETPVPSSQAQGFNPPLTTSSKKKCNSPSCRSHSISYTIDRRQSQHLAFQPFSTFVSTFPPPWSALLVCTSKQIKNNHYDFNSKKQIHDISIFNTNLTLTRHLQAHMTCFNPKKHCSCRSTPHLINAASGTDLTLLKNGIWIHPKERVKFGHRNLDQLYTVFEYGIQV